MASVFVEKERESVKYTICNSLCPFLRSSSLKLQREKVNQRFANNETKEKEVVEEKVVEEKEEEEEEGAELEVMRHFEAVDRKVFNRGDSHNFRRRERSDRRMARFLSEDQTEDPSKTYKVSFLGAPSVGKGRLHFIFLHNAMGWELRLELIYLH